MQQLRDRLESISLLQFLQLCHGCIGFVFPTTEDVMKASHLLNLLDQNWLHTLSVVQQTPMIWLKDGIMEVPEEGDTYRGIISYNKCYFYW